MPAHKKDTVGSYVKNKEVVSFKPIMHSTRARICKWGCSCGATGRFYGRMSIALKLWQDHVAKMHPNYET